MDGLVHRPVPDLPAGWFRLSSTARRSGPSITTYTSMAKVQGQNSTVCEMSSSESDGGGGGVSVPDSERETKMASWFGKVLGHIPLIGGMLGYAGDIVSGFVNTTLGVLSFGESGTLGSGLRQIGHGLGNELDTLARDFSATVAGAVGTVYSTLRDAANLATLGQVPELGGRVRAREKWGFFGGTKPTGVFLAFGRALFDALLPEYGTMGGTQWGVPSFGYRRDLILNQSDVASRQHDIYLQHFDWIRRQYSTSPESQWVGPVGAAYAILGTIPFATWGWIRGQR